MITIFILILFTILNKNLLRKLNKSLDENYLEKYKEFKIKFNKNFTIDVDNKKFEIFKDNFKFINNFNKNSNGIKLKINEFADMTFNDFNNKLLEHFSNLENLKENDFDRSSPIEYRNIDYSDKLNEVKNLNLDFNKIEYNLMIDLIDSNYYINQNNYIQFSENFLENCINEKNKKSIFLDVSNYLKNNGLIEKGYIKKNYCNIDRFSSKINNYKIYNLKNYDDLFRIWNKEKLVLIPIYLNRKLMFYNKGIFDDDENNCNGKPNFYLLLYGIYYKDNNFYYLKFKSILGKSWGENGKLRIRFSKNDKENIGFCSMFKKKSFLIEF